MVNRPQDGMYLDLVSNPYGMGQDNKIFTTVGET